MYRSDLPQTYQPQVVAFIDVLGFKQFVEGIPANVFDRYEKLIEILLRLRLFRPPYARHSPFDDLLDTRGITTFSDSIVLSQECTPIGLLGVLLDTAALTLELLASGLLCRGGISTGLLHHDRDLVFGEGLHKAYLLESEYARLPRVILDSEAYSFTRDLAADSFFTEFIEAGLLVDADGFARLHIFNEPWISYMHSRVPGDMAFFTEVLSKVREGLVAMLRNAPDTEAVRQKLRWYAEYFNACLSGAELPVIPLA